MHSISRCHQLKSTIGLQGHGVCVWLIVALQTMQSLLNAWRWVKRQRVTTHLNGVVAAKRFIRKTTTVTGLLTRAAVLLPGYPAAVSAGLAGTPHHHNRCAAVRTELSSTESPATLSQVLAKILSCGAMICSAVRKTRNVRYFTRFALQKNNGQVAGLNQFKTMEMQYNQKFAVKTATFAQEELCSN